MACFRVPMKPLRGLAWWLHALHIFLIGWAMKVVNIKTYQVLKSRQKQEMVYRYSLQKMNKAELLQELLNYHESYQRDPHDINVTLRGQHLMEILEARAELTDLKDLSREFQDKLQVRLYKQMQKISEKN